MEVVWLLDGRRHPAGRHLPRPVVPELPVKVAEWSAKVLVEAP